MQKKEINPWNIQEKYCKQKNNLYTNIFRSYCKDIKLNIIFKTSNRLHNAFKFKDQLPKCISLKVLYKCKCGICNNVYIGKTKSHLIICQYGHLGKSIATEKPLRDSDKDATAIRKHCHSLDLSASINNFYMLGNAMNKYHFSRKESHLIFELKPSVLNVGRVNYIIFV